jgi:hypothetical protein
VPERGFVMSYQEGFEDSLELCLLEVKKSKSKRDALGKIQYFLGLVKEHKFDRIKEMIGALK